MFPLPPSTLRAGTVVVLLTAAFASPKAAEHRVTRADSKLRDPAGEGPRGAHGLPVSKPARSTPVPRDAPPPQTTRCSVAVAYPDDLPADRRVTLTNLVADHDCPSKLNTTVGLTFEIDDPRPGRTLWWRRAESSFDVLRPSSGSIAAGRSRVSVSSLVLDQTVTIEVLEGDRRLMSFTVRHF
jgi:hypothetical protein